LDREEDEEEKNFTAYEDGDGFIHYPLYFFH
jgi:hypothetical protein